MRRSVDAQPRAALPLRPPTARIACLERRTSDVRIAQR
jgi:hypothetical protein